MKKGLIAAFAVFAGGYLGGMIIPAWAILIPCAVATGFIVATINDLKKPDDKKEKDA